MGQIVFCLGQKSPKFEKNQLNHSNFLCSELDEERKLYLITFLITSNLKEFGPYFC